MKRKVIDKNKGRAMGVEKKQLHPAQHIHTPYLAGITKEIGNTTRTTVNHHFEWEKYAKNDAKSEAKNENHTRTKGAQKKKKRKS